jgi:parvulin-like peptidyl-prolyl isomerase
MKQMRSTMKKRFFLSLVLLSNFSFIAALGAEETAQVKQDVDPAQIIAYQGDVFLTQETLDAAFDRIPEKNRLRFIRDGGRVDQLIRSLLQRLVIAADATKAGFEQNPLVAQRMALAAQKELAEAWIQKVVGDAPAANYETLAYENYLANPEAYRSPVKLDISHILLSTDERSLQEAELLAGTLRAQLAEDPATFDALVMEYSDDPAKSANAGRYPEMVSGQMVESFELAAFALEQDGEISQPVKTDYGYHIIRLNRRYGNVVPEYNEVKTDAITRVKASYLEIYRQNFLRNLLSDPIVFPEGSVEIMAKRYFGEDLELAPNY